MFQMLTDALRRHDLRDYMLLKSREPGPRAKHTDLPAITYATIRTGMGYGLGMCVSYRFFLSDVQMIARLVHGNVQDHMKDKANKREALKNQRLRKLHLELKIRFHTDKVEAATRQEIKDAHQECESSHS